MSIKLTDTQIVMLSAAAQRDDRCLVAPRNLKGGAAQKVAAKLIDAGLAKEIKAKPEAPAWRQDEQTGQSFALKLTAAGVRATADATGLALDESSERTDPRLQVTTTSSRIVDAAADVPASAPSLSAPAVHDLSASIQCLPALGESLRRGALLGGHASKESSARGDGSVELRSNRHVIELAAPRGRSCDDHRRYCASLRAGCPHSRSC
jgi:hypothetical protein